MSESQTHVPRRIATPHVGEIAVDTATPASAAVFVSSCTTSETPFNGAGDGAGAGAGAGGGTGRLRDNVRVGGAIEVTVAVVVVAASEEQVAPV